MYGELYHYFILSNIQTEPRDNYLSWKLEGWLGFVLQALDPCRISMSLLSDHIWLDTSFLEDNCLELYKG